MGAAWAWSSRSRRGRSFSALDLRGLVWLWPALVVAVFAGRAPAAPALAGDAGTPTCRWAGPGPSPPWSAASPRTWPRCSSTATRSCRRSERTLQYLDLSYQLSLAGEAKHAFPPGVPQVAGEPLYYHWFGHAHMAMTSLVGAHRPAGGGDAAGHPGAVRAGHAAHRGRRLAGVQPPVRRRGRRGAVLRRRRVQLHPPGVDAVRDAGHVRHLARHVHDLQLGAADRRHRAAGRRSWRGSDGRWPRVGPSALGSRGLGRGRAAAARLQRRQGELAAGDRGRARAHRRGAAGRAPPRAVGGGRGRPAHRGGAAVRHGRALPVPDVRRRGRSAAGARAVLGLGRRSRRR